MHKKYAEHAEELSKQLIEMVESDHAPWKAGYDISQVEPESYASGRFYSGSNAMKLMLTSMVKGYEDNRWITENAAAKEGGRVTGKGVDIVFATDTKQITVKNEETGEDEKKLIKLDSPIIKHSVVFNMSQVEGMEVKERADYKTLGWKQADLLNEIHKKTQADISFSGDPAYIPSVDKISLPPPESYAQEEKFASTLLHEVTHWTGNENRLDRKFGTNGDQDYAREELVAELSVLLTASRTGIEVQPANSEAYIAGWWQGCKEMLEDDPTKILGICKDVYQARDYIIEGRELERLEELGVTHKVELTPEEKENGRIDLSIPYKEKNPAKKLARNLGVDLKWDKQGKTWFANVEDGQDIGNLSKYRILDNDKDFSAEFDAAKKELNSLYDTSLRAGMREDMTAPNAFEMAKNLHKISGDEMSLKAIIDDLTDFASDDYRKEIYALADLKGVMIPEENKTTWSTSHALFGAEPVTADSATGLKALLEEEAIVKNKGLENYSGVFKMIERDQDGGIVKSETMNTEEFLKHVENENEEVIENQSAPVPDVQVTNPRFNKQTLDVTREGKDEAKEVAKLMGTSIKWDRKNKNWYTNANKETADKLQSKFDEMGLSSKGKDKENSSDLSTSEASKRHDFKIHYTKKDQAKQLGKNLGVDLKFDRHSKSWYANTTEEKAKAFKDAYYGDKPAKKSTENDAAPMQSNKDAINKDAAQKLYVNIPFDEKDKIRDELKDKGVKLSYDSDFKAFYVDKNKDGEKVASYVPEAPKSALASVGAFQDKLLEIGAKDTTITPRLDGKWHRIQHDSDKRGKASISYRGYNNGIANATIKNHKTGESLKWIDSKNELSAEDKRKLRISNKNNLEAARVKDFAIRNQAAETAKELVEKSSAASDNHPYFKAKGIQSHTLKEDEKGNLVVPLTNINGEIRSVQRINKEGGKFYQKGGEKTGNFYAYGKPTNGKPIIITEGVATAASIYEISGEVALAALDSGNLKPVLEAVIEKYPDSKLVIAADNDHTLKINGKLHNVGVLKAEEANTSVGGQAVVIKPEIDSPNDKHITDFNDVAKERPEGKVEVARAIKGAIDRANMRDKIVEAKKPEKAAEKSKEATKKSSKDRKQVNDGR